MICGWIGGVDDPERLLPLLEPVSSQGLEIYAVGLEVNSPAYDLDKVVRKVDSRWTAFH